MNTTSSRRSFHAASVSASVVFPHPVGPEILPRTGVFVAWRCFICAMNRSSSPSVEK